MIKLRRFSKIDLEERVKLEDEYLKDKKCWDVKAYTGMCSDSPNQKKWNKELMTYNEALELAKSVVKGEVTKGKYFNDHWKSHPEFLVGRNRKASTELLKEAREKGILPKP